MARSLLGHLQNQVIQMEEIIPHQDKSPILNHHLNSTRQQQQPLPGKRSPPSRQYSMPTDTFPPRNQLPPRQQQQQQYDPRMVGQRQVSAPQQQRMYNDIPPSRQRPPQDFPLPHKWRRLSNEILISV